ncbi:MAG: DUF2281 domain-containing protein [Spirulina sp. SIO3F2]|nr:DUF2281 domain-containing protein [Spirulina sp. SIO3F2]
MAIAESQTIQSQAGQTTSLKEQIIQALEPLTPKVLQQVLDYVQQLQSEDEQEANHVSDEVPEGCRSEVWAAYLESEKERAEVYRRLANS